MVKVRRPNGSYVYEDLLFLPTTPPGSNQSLSCLFRARLHEETLELFVIVDDQLIPQKFEVAFLDERVDDARDCFTRSTRHVREVLLEREFIDFHPAFPDRSDIVGELQNDACH